VRLLLTGGLFPVTDRFHGDGLATEQRKRCDSSSPFREALKIQIQSRAPLGTGVACLRPLEAVELVEIAQRLEGLDAGCPVAPIVC
jgi:hypothetical protein